MKVVLGLCLLVAVVAGIPCDVLDSMVVGYVDDLTEACASTPEQDLTGALNVLDGLNQLASMASKENCSELASRISDTLTPLSAEDPCPTACEDYTDNVLQAIGECDNARHLVAANKSNATVLEQADDMTSQLRKLQDTIPKRCDFPHRLLAGAFATHGNCSSVSEATLTNESTVGSTSAVKTTASTTASITANVTGEDGQVGNTIARSTTTESTTQKATTVETTTKDTAIDTTNTAEDETAITSSAAPESTPATSTADDTTSTTSTALGDDGASSSTTTSTAAAPPPGPGSSTQHPKIVLPAHDDLDDVDVLGGEPQAAPAGSFAMFWLLVLLVLVVIGVVYRENITNYFSQSKAPAGARGQYSRVHHEV
eukprot:m.20724 g.20724  ORF g.20724 m.20724 type:complete len:371 (-) comp11047_c0_seq1:96-1208(-)